MNLDAPFSELVGGPVARALLAANIDSRLVLVFQLAEAGERYGYAVGRVGDDGEVTREETRRGLTLAGTTRALLADLPPEDPVRSAIGNHPELEAALKESLS